MQQLYILLSLMWFDLQKTDTFLEIQSLASMSFMYLKLCSVVNINAVLQIPYTWFVWRWF